MQARWSVGRAVSPQVAREGVRGGGWRALPVRRPWTHAEAEAGDVNGGPPKCEWGEDLGRHLRKMGGKGQRGSRGCPGPDQHPHPRHP